MARDKSKDDGKGKKKRPRGRPPTGTDPIRAVRVSDEQWAHWQAAADAVGVPLSVWIRQVCNRKAKRLLGCGSQVREL